MHAYENISEFDMNQKNIIMHDVLSKSRPNEGTISIIMELSITDQLSKHTSHNQNNITKPFPLRDRFLVVFPDNLHRFLSVLISDYNHYYADKSEMRWTNIKGMERNIKSMDDESLCGIALNECMHLVSKHLNLTTKNNQFDHHLYLIQLHTK